MQDPESPRAEPYVPLRDRLKMARARRVESESKADPPAQDQDQRKRHGMLRRSHSDSELDQLDGQTSSLELDSSDESGSAPTSVRGALDARKGSLKAFKNKVKSLKVSIHGGLEALKRTMSDPKDEKEPAKLRKDWRNEVTSESLLAEQLRAEHERNKTQRIRSSSSLRRLFSMPLSTTIESTWMANDIHTSEKEAPSSSPSPIRRLSTVFGLNSRKIKPSYFEEESDDSDEDAPAGRHPDQMFSSRSPHPADRWLHRKSSVLSLDSGAQSGSSASLASVAALGVAGGRQRRLSSLIVSLADKPAAPTGHGWRARVQAWYASAKVSRHRHSALLYSSACRVAVCQRWFGLTATSDILSALLARWPLQLLPQVPVHPASGPRILWDLLILCLALSTTLLYPFEFAFREHLSGPQNGGFASAVGFIFAIDIVINFITGYQRHDMSMCRVQPQDRQVAKRCHEKVPEVKRGRDPGRGNVYKRERGKRAV